MTDLLGAIILVLSTQGWLALGIHSIYKTAEAEKERVEHQANREAKRTLQILKESVSKVIEQRQVTFLVVAVTMSIGITWALNQANYGSLIVPLWAFSLALVQSQVLFFSILSIYHVVSGKIRPGIKQNRVFEPFITCTAFSGAILVSLASTAGCIYDLGQSCTVQGYLNSYIFALFFIVLFISGLGEIGIINTVADAFASHVPIRKTRQLAYMTLLLLSLASLYALIRSGFLSLGELGLFGGAGLELGFLVAFSYLVYWRIKKKSFRPSTIVYVILMFALSGLFIGYNLGNENPPNLTPTGVEVPDILAQYSIPILLFAVGYTNLLIRAPQVLERRLKASEKFLPYFTFLLAFSALGSYQLAAFTLGPGIFLFQKQVLVDLGLLVAAVLLTLRKIKGTILIRRLKPSTLIPFCGHCESRLTPTSKFCRVCGAPATPKPEQVLFLGKGEILGVRNARHTKRRKIVSLLTGGPVGYLAFGRDLTRKPVKEGQLLVTEKAMYIEGDFFPISRLAGIRRGSYSNSLVLEMRAPMLPSQSEKKAQESQESRTEVELKASDIESLTQGIEDARRMNHVTLPAGS